MSESATRAQQVSQVIAEYLTAVESGQAPDCEELIRQHPHLAEELTAFFRDRNKLQDFAEGLPAPVTEGKTLLPKQIAPSDFLTEAPEKSAIQADTTFAADRRFGNYELLEVNGSPPIVPAC